MTHSGLTALDHHLLGILADGAAFGYQIIERLETRPHTLEVANLGSVTVYQALAALEKRGWVTVSKQQVGTSQLRAQYEITEAGRNALWLATEQALRDFPTSFSFRRGLAYAHVLSPGILASRLLVARDEMAERLAKISGADLADEPLVRQSLIANERSLLQTTLEWLGDLAESLEASVAGEFEI
ncbi:MAG: helix-turn-helix transcriptional regulator [Candidatus Sericytochromatia bacterium]|nr:helix-turn-helix transcriptional regulator [Candidatus Tanganyikabacteria bacterium]